MRLDYETRGRALLERLPLRSLYLFAEILIIGLIVLQLVRLIWTVFLPLAPLGMGRMVSASAVTPDILRNFDPFFRLEATTPGATAVVTPLQLVLFGTRIDEAMGRGSAIIATPDGVQNSYAVGEEIMPGVKLKQVAFDHVTLTRGGADEDLFIDQSTGALPDPAGLAGPAPAGGAQTSLAALPARAGVSLGQMKAEIGFIPRIDGGRVTGLVVRPQGSGGVFRQVGLKEGDVLTQIGGRPVTGQNDIDGLAVQFANGGNISLTVERGAEVLPLVITVSGK